MCVFNDKNWLHKTNLSKKHPALALVLGRKFSISTAYIQDPAMNVLDKQIVTSLGYTVLHDPEAMNAMTLTTFLYAPNNEFSVIENLLLVASPALYLGTELTFFYDNIL